MKVVKKKVHRSDDGIVGTVEHIYDEADLRRAAEHHATTQRDAAMRQAQTADTSGAADEVDLFAQMALDWEVVRMVATGQVEGTLELNEDGQAIGATVKRRPDRIVVTRP